MASNTKGERRWASSTKRSGMTVLGKVAVPKPINLPSQRLENHGLDPNVEIVPKGSLSWGTRSSSSGSNAWGSSSVLSPRTDGGSASPSQLSGRPSSGGGTRPSTAGSERTPDSTSNTWTSSTRPSSASGMLASNNTLTALRPRSAETRPGNSQLSRFAEPLAEGTAAWGASGAADKLGIGASSNEGFSLSSGDFPTLGSEKNPGKSMESLDHNSNGHPGSSFGGPSATTERMEVAPGDDASRPTDVQSGMANSWKNDGPRSVEDGPHPSMERWHGDPYPYPTPNIPPNPYETWRGGAPINPPGGIWFRGPPRAPYGTPPMAGPGSFPMEPFPYYRPQVPAPGLVNSQTVPPHCAGPRGPHSKNGDLSRPIMEPYMRPGTPIRPGFYPGYYGPPMGFCNPNERDYPFMGMPAGPPVYNRYPNQNAPESTNSNARSCEGKKQEQVESDSPNDSQRYHSIPVKQNKGWDKNVEEAQLDHKVTANVHPHEKGYAANSSSQENFWSEGHRKDEQMNDGKRSLQSEQTSSDLLEDKNVSTDPGCVKFHGNTSRGESGNVNPGAGNVAILRDQRLIQKIEGLNQKVRASDGRDDIHRDEPYSKGEVVNLKASHAINEADGGVHLERHYPSGILVPVSRNMTALAEDKSFGSTFSNVTTISRRSSHTLQGRGDHGGKGRSNSQEADGWRKRSATSESPGIVSVVGSERNTNIQGKEQSPAVQATEVSCSAGEVKDVSMLDPCDSQRVKMREIAKQRAIQLQKEEEERIREQKAKAFAKLEELNRRSANQGKEAIRDNTDNVPSDADVPQKQEESDVKIELQFGSNPLGEMASIGAHGNFLSKARMASESNPSSGVICSQTNQYSHQDDPVLAKKGSLPATDDAHISDVAGPNVQGSEISRQKRAGYKQKHNIHSGKNLAEKPAMDAKENSSSIVTMLKEIDVKGISSSSESILPVDLPKVSDSLVQPKRKNNRAGKNKHKVDDSFAVSLASVQKETDVCESVTESMKLDTIESKPEPLDVQPPVDSKDISQPLEIHPSLPRDDVQHRGNNSWKPQHARKVLRNSQGRSTEKSYSNDVVWAPVKSHNNIEVIDDNEQKAEGAVPSIRSDNAVPSSSKSKRAEMERYVPKAAIKETAQQGSIQLSASSSIDPDNTGSRGHSRSQTIERTGRPVESRHAGSKPKQAQTHGSWRQCVSNESSFVQGSGDRSTSMMNPTKNSQTFDELQQSQKPKELPKGSAPKASKQDEQPMERQPQPSGVYQDIVVDGWNIIEEPTPSGTLVVDGWNIIEEPTSSGTLSGVKDHGTAGKGKRNSFKGHKGSGNPQSFYRKNHNYAEADADYYSETSQPDRPASSKGKNVAHWQPKSQTHVTNQQGNMAQGRQGVTVEGEKIFKREASETGSLQGKQHSSQDTAKSMDHPQVYSAPENKDVTRMPNMGSQETVVGRKAGSSKDHAYPPKDLVVEAESAPVGHTDGTNSEQRPSSSGYRRNGNYNGRFNRSNEFRGDRSFITHENRQNYAPANREKQRQNARFEYQPVGPYSPSKRGNNSDGQIENQHAGPRSRGGRQGSDSRRGGASFYGRQSVNNQTDAGY